MRSRVYALLFCATRSFVAEHDDSRVFLSYSLAQVGLSWGASAIQAGVSKVQEAGVVDAAKDAYFKVSSVAVTAATSVKERLESAAQGPQKPLANFPKGKIAATGFGSDSYSSQQPGNSDNGRGNSSGADFDELPFSSPAARISSSSSSSGSSSISRPAGNSGSSASAPVRVRIFASCHNRQRHLRFAFS